MFRTTIPLLVVILTTAAAPAQSPPAANTFQPVGRVTTAHTAKSRELWTNIYTCYRYVGSVVKYVTKDVGAPAVAFVKALVKKPATADELLEDARDIVAPWLDGRGRDEKPGKSTQRK